MPQVQNSQDSVLAHALAGVAGLVIRHPRTVICLGIAAVGLSLALSTRMTYRTGRSNVVNLNSEFNQRYLEYAKEFGDKEDVVVVVHGRNRTEILPALEELSHDVAAKSEFFQAVFHDQIDFSKLRAKGLHYLNAAQLEEIERGLTQMAPLLAGEGNLASAREIAQTMMAGMQDSRQAPRPEEMAALEKKLLQMCQILSMALRSGGDYQSPWPDMSSMLGRLAEAEPQPVNSTRGRYGFVLLQLVRDDAGQFIQNSDAIEALRGMLARVRARYPQLEFGLTGLPVMENDEMRCSESSMTLATVISLLGVLVVMVAGFGGLRHSLLVMAALACGMIWSLGYTTLAVGHLNILSSAYGSILVGLGINYSIYTVARYLQLRGGHQPVDESLIGTHGSVAPGITIGATTTALALFAAAFTEFTGVAELGMIAGGGIVLCWISAMALLPAILRLFDAKRAERALPVPLPFHRWIDPLVARPAVVFLLCLGVTLWLGAALPRVQFDYNLLNMEPEGLESVEWEQRLLSETTESVNFALSIADSPDETLARKERFLKLPSVERVDEIASLYPPNAEQKRPIIGRIAEQLSHLPKDRPRLPIPSAAELRSCSRRPSRCSPPIREP